MKAQRVKKATVKPYFLKIEDFKGGTNTLINPARKSTKFAHESVNLQQVQDGIWRTRDGTDYYGSAITGETSIDGAYPYLKADGSEEIIAIAGGTVYKSSDGGAWTEVTGGTFTSGLKPFFLQINSRLYITNGTDSLAYYDGTELQTYTALTDPSAPDNASRSTLTTGDYNNYYRVVAVNSVGYTNPSGSLNITTNKQRDSWATGESVSFDLPTVSGVEGWQIYWGEIDGQELYMTSLQAGATSFTDDGTYTINEYMETPDDNTTAAPKFRSMEVSGNRIWATYDSDHEYRVHYSGTGQYLGYFSPFYGGGWVDLEKGGRNKPTSCVHYRDGKGNPVITVLCSSPDGKGTTFQIELTSISVGDVSFTVPAAYKIVGSIGGDAPQGVVKVGDNIFYANKKGLYALRNKAQMFNVLSTDDLTAPIRNRYESLDPSKIANIVGYYKAPYVYFSLPSSSTNDTTILFDMERNNWVWKWTIGFNQFLEYTDSNSITRLLAVPTTGNKLVEISSNIQGDMGNGFYQSYLSPLISVHEDYTVKAKIKEATFELGKLRGQVTCEVVGLKADAQATTLGTRTRSANTGTTGWGEALFGEVLYGDSLGTPETFAEDTSKITVEVGDSVYSIQFHVYSTQVDAYWELLGIETKGNLIPSRSPFEWQE